MSICIDGHAFVAIKRANCVVETKQFFFQGRKSIEEFDIEVTDTTEDLMERMTRDVVFDAGFPLAL